METPVAKKIRVFRGEDAILNILADYKKSKLSIKTFCIENSIASATFHNWKKGKFKGVSNALDVATRISYVLGIFKALELLYETPAHADRWINQPNAAFGGQTAAERMLSGQIIDLAAVRDYLDSVRGGW